MQHISLKAFNPSNKHKNKATNLWTKPNQNKSPISRERNFQ